MASRVSSSGPVRERPLGLLGAMEVDHQAARGGLPQQVFGEIDHLLCFVIEEIDFGAGGPGLLKAVEKRPARFSSRQIKAYGMAPTP
jgi:hypothetical protein